jgi:ATP-dependent RNA helicase SUPV3L1/SUV3
LAASGRTSIPVDKETPKALYRTSGYRMCGERAVRVDILERLADLIRPALSWREGGSAAKPDGAFDRRGFTVTGAMTSLTGASGEDFSSILRSLGYRMDRRPKPAEPVAAPATETPVESNVEQSPPVDIADAKAGEDAIAAGPPESSTPAPAASSISLLPQTDFLNAADRVTVADPGAADGAAAPAEMAKEPVLEAPAAPAPNVAQASEASEASEAVQAAEEPAFIEVWRPAGRSERRPHRPRRPPRAVQAAPPAAPAEGQETAAKSNGAAPAENNQSADQPRRDRPHGADHQARRDRHERQQRAERQRQHGERQGTSQDRGPRRDRPRRKRDDGPDRAEREQYYAKPYGSGGDRRDKQPDPNSPFAKLAALKQQLEQNGKEPT